MPMCGAMSTGGTVALSGDIITAQEIFRSAVALSASSCPPDRHMTGCVGAVGPAAITRPQDLRRRALVIAQRNSAVSIAT